MTAPVAHGYPDYGRYAARADKLIDQASAVTISATTTHGRYFVGDVPFVLPFLFADANHIRWRVQFYDAATGGNLLAGFAISTRQGSQFDATVPVVGPFMSLQITPSAANTTYSFILSTAHSAIFDSPTSATDNVLATINQSVAAGATVTSDSTRVWPGEATWFVRSTSTNWQFRIDTIDYLGAMLRVEHVALAAAGTQRGVIFLAPANMRLTVINGDAVAREFSTSLVARPIDPGR
jgi:hypothetical protein